ncbi:MAG: AlpA family phage regulatory protein [Pseudoxanthomonas sp.]
MTVEQQLRMKQVTEQLGLGRSTMYKLSPTANFLHRPS